MSHKKPSKTRDGRRKRRHARVRKKIWGTAGRPRLVVFRSLKNFEGQLVDDDAGRAVATGIYVYRMRAGEAQRTRKLLLLR